MGPRMWGSFCSSTELRPLPILRKMAGGGGRTWGEELSLYPLLLLLLVIGTVTSPAHALSLSLDGTTVAEERLCGEGKRISQHPFPLPSITPPLEIVSHTPQSSCLTAVGGNHHLKEGSSFALLFAFQRIGFSAERAPDDPQKVCATSNGKVVITSHKQAVWLYPAHTAQVDSP